MLKSLSVREFALIREIDVSFGTGLNIITGETGAGKSILIDAMGLILGARSNTEDVRQGAQKAVVEAVFVVRGNKLAARLLQENELDLMDELILRREVSSKGQSRCFVNDTPVTLAVLRSFGDVLVDLHGQHEHQSLLRAETHGELLDDFGRLEGLRADYQSSFAALRKVTVDLASLREKEQEYAKMRDLYEFQLNEIDEVGPTEGEEVELEQERKILENAERLYESTATLHQSLYDGERSAHDLLVAARNQLEDLSDIDPAFGPLRDECVTATVIVEELTKFLQSYSSRIEFNPERLEFIRERLGKLSLLRRKYGGSLDAVLQHRETIGREFDVATHFDEEIAGLETQRRNAVMALADVGHRLSTKRNDLVGKISTGVEKTLATLGIPQGRFVVRLEPLQPRAGMIAVQEGKSTIYAGPTGLDEVEFLLSTNPGEEPKPLVKIASGGEISRVMLALKSILAKSERLPLLVFDEIDTGISGRIAQAVGKMLKSLASYHQIIAITHLPQIAGLADAHYAVEKRESKGRTSTTLRELPLEERVHEVAKLLSGSEVTQRSLDGARELMGLEG